MKKGRHVKRAKVKGTRSSEVPRHSNLAVALGRAVVFDRDQKFPSTLQSKIKKGLRKFQI